MLLSVAEGKVADADVHEHQRRVSDDPRFQPDFVQLWDSRGALPASGKTDPDQVQFISAPITRRAILVSTELSFGLGRQFELTRYETHEGGLKIFQQLADALAWIERTQADYDELLASDDWVDI